MLKSIKLQDFAIVDACTIPFAPGFNVISGETGAGKTILTKALRLCLGAKADSTFIRKGAEVAIVEATFDSVTLRRELRRDGKNRLFLNGAPTTLAELQSLSLFDLVSQNESASLRSKEAQRELLDRFAGVELEAMQRSYAEWQESEKALFALQEKKRTLLPKLSQIEKALEEIQTLDPYEGELDELFALHKKHMEALAEAEKRDHVAGILSAALGHLATLSPPPSIAELVKGGKAQLEEASYLIERERPSFSSQEIEETSSRLSAINALVKRYGGTFAALKEARAHLESEVELAHSIDQFLHEQQEEVSRARGSLETLAEAVSAKRKMGAQRLQERVTTSLQELHMPHAAFLIEIESAPLGPTGSDAIAFLLRANKGETMLPLSEAPSGGEIARLLFALKLCVSETNTIIFDEIDANIGGETARTVGEKLAALGKEKQVLCITHFPQVAELADHHLQIRKEEGERTLCRVRPLAKAEREAELLRMLGGKRPIYLVDAEKVRSSL